MIETIIFGLLGVFVGLTVGFISRVILVEKGFQNAELKAKRLVDEATKTAERNKKETLVETKQEIHNLKLDADKLIKERSKLVEQQENKLLQREQNLDNRSSKLDNRENNLDRKEESLENKKLKLDEMNNKLETVIDEQNEKLYKIARYTQEQARDLIMNRVEEELSQEISIYIKEEEDKAKLTTDRKAKELMAIAMQKYAQDVTCEKTVSVVHLPNDEMKGRIIGREGRNIRTIEALTGIDLIIDDTPEAVVLSGFDPIRREIAKLTIETLVNDGRIHPGRIEEVVEKARKDIDTRIRDIGEEAVFEVGIGRVHPDLVKLLGRLHFRTSYGQNVLRHSVETAFLAGKLAAELGEDEVLAKRAGLLHDIGKALDHDVEGSHVDIGGAVVSKYKEPKTVINSIKSHHGDCPAESVIAVLVAAADALSAARPGARSESLENYLKRLEQLEAISTSVKGVESAYAIQAGREVRVIVKSDEVDDASTHKIARDIKEQVEAQLSYPGTIKVTVIRETRASNIAK